MCASKVCGDKVAISLEHPVVFVAEHLPQVFLVAPVTQHLSRERMPQVVPGATRRHETGLGTKPLNNPARVSPAKRQAVTVHKQRIAGEPLTPIEVLSERPSHGHAERHVAHRRWPSRSRLPLDTERPLLPVNIPDL